MEIREQDLKIDIFHIKTDPVNHGPRGVSITHIPTGTVAEAWNGKSQLENKATALRALKLALEDEIEEEAGGGAVMNGLLWTYAQQHTRDGKTRLQALLNDLSVEELRWVSRAATRLAHYANVELDSKLRMGAAFEGLTEEL